MNHAELLVHGHFIGGPCDQSVGKEVSRNPWNGESVGTYAEGDWGVMRVALESSAEAFDSWSRTSVRERAELLQRIAQAIAERKEELSLLLCAEVGKPITLARAEVERTILTFQLAAGAADVMAFKSQDLSYDKRSAGLYGGFKPIPRGPVLAIVPYNWPLNLTAHKIAPALLAGCTVVVKPSPLAAVTTLTLCRLIHEVGLPAGVLNAVTCMPAEAEKAAKAEQVKVVSFTGSAPVGWHLKDILPRKKLLLELGGNAYGIVCADADLSASAAKLAAGAFSYAGQICISVQNIRVDKKIRAEFQQLLIGQIENLGVGDPLNEGTVCGPMIHAAAKAALLEKLVDQELLTGPIRHEGNLLHPILVEARDPNSPIVTEEIFGPVATLSSFESVEEALSEINRSRWGIHAGVFTEDASLARAAIDALKVGGVVHNSAPTLRFDSLPYGGTKESGWGREGVQFAVQEYCELKSFVSDHPIQLD